MDKVSSNPLKSVHGKLLINNVFFLFLVVELFSFIIHVCAKSLNSCGKTNEKFHNIFIGQMVDLNLKTIKSMKSHQCIMKIALELILLLSVGANRTWVQKMIGKGE